MAIEAEVVHTDKVALAMQPSPFCHATKCQGIVYCSGSIGLDPATKKLVEGPIQARTTRALANLKLVLEAAGTEPKNILKANVYLTDMKNFSAMNEAWFEFFNTEAGGYVPARTCVAVYQLPLGTDVEIECTAHLGDAVKSKL